MQLDLAGYTYQRRRCMSEKFRVDRLRLTGAGQVKEDELTTRKAALAFRTLCMNSRFSLSPRSTLGTMLAFSDVRCLEVRF